MNDSTDLKDVIKWVGIAILASIPVVLILRRLAEEPEAFLGDSSDIFAEELQG